MSNGFSWNKILGGNEAAPTNGQVAEAPESQVADVAAPPVAPPVAAPVSAPTDDADLDLPFGGFDRRGVGEEGFQAAEPTVPPVASAPPVAPAPEEISVEASGATPVVPGANDELREILARIRNQDAEANGVVPTQEVPAPPAAEAPPEPVPMRPALDWDDEPVPAAPPVVSEKIADFPPPIAPALDWDDEPVVTPPAFSRVEVTHDGLGDAQLAPPPVADAGDPFDSIFAQSAPPVLDGPPPAAPPFAQTSEAAKLNPPPPAPPRVEPEAAFEDGVDEDDLNWSTPIAAPEPPKVSPNYVSKLPEEVEAQRVDPILQEVEKTSQNQIIKGSVPQNLDPVEPPSLVPPMMMAPPVLDDPKTRLSTPDSDLTSFKQAAKEAGLPNVEDIHIDDILRIGVERKASDIHLTVGLPPMARIDGEVVPLPWVPITQEDTRRLIYDILTNEQLEKYERTHELDFGHTVPGVGRFRVNAYMQRGSVAAAMRTIPNKIPEFDSLGLPSIVREMAKRTSGLILVTGPTGSGKSTTIATMIDDINRRMKGHIMTIEDPIEYMHQHRNCMVNQREMHSDTYSFHNALRAVLREDPDIILVGELRDLETIEAALTLAETGHLVFGTLHTRNAPSTIDRIIDVFPKDAQEQIRVLLSNTLEGVVSQQLLPALGGGRRACIEIMMATPAIKNLIREGKTHQMYSVLETSGNIGMQTMDAQLAELYRNGTCDFEECLIRSIDKETFARLAKRV